jgi:penicillin amidase
MVVSMENVSNSYGVYPGGQSENPASNLYSNYVSIWISGNYLPLYFIPSANQFPSSLIMDTIELW